MRWVATWLTACMATATFGQVHIIDRHDVTGPPAVQINDSNPGHIPVTNENNLLNEVNNYVSSKDGSSSLEDSINESSRSRGSGEPASGENPSNEKPNPSNEIPELSNESSSKEIPSPSNESPEASNEISSPSNEIPSTSNESPEASNEIPSPSNEIPSPSNESPEASNEISSPSNEIPSPSNESPEASNEISSPSNEIPSPSNESPEASNEISSPSNEIPSPSNESPEASNEIPNPSNEVPIPSNEISEESNEIPSPSNEIPEVPDSSSDDSKSNNSNGSGEEDDLPEIETTLGPVKGVKWHDTDIIAYIDIPYGKTGTPFAAPQTAEAWETIHKVEEHTKRCPQFIDDGYQGDLSCLTLSVFAPAGAEAASVLFHIHNSNFHSGDPMIYGPEHLVSKGVILVLPNYRIGALGFLCLQNETAPGNAGLKDLSKALDWIVDNIKGFGGNPSNIVVSGDGEAGALAGYLALSPRSNSNIKKVITESGSMLSHVALDRHPEDNAWTLAENIRNENTDAILNNPFAEASTELLVRAAKGMRFNPCIERNEEPFIGVSPWGSLQNREINITFMIGSASHAGAHQAVATSDSFIENLNEDYGLFLPKDLSFHSTAERDQKALEVKSQYFGNATISRDHVKELSLWFTDASYLGPVMRYARCLVDAGATVYVFEFDYVGELNRELIALGSPVEGAARSDIIGYLFTQDRYSPEEESRDKKMIDLMMELWVSFINTGIPRAGGIEWSGLKAGAASEEEFLHITSETKPEKGVHVDRLRVWTDLYNNFFIERNFAILINPGNYVFITLIFWLTRTKLDYQ